MNPRSCTALQLAVAHRPNWFGGRGEPKVADRLLPCKQGTSLEFSHTLADQRRRAKLFTLPCFSGSLLFFLAKRLGT